MREQSTGPTPEQEIMVVAMGSGCIRLHPESAQESNAREHHVEGVFILLDATPHDVTCSTLPVFLEGAANSADRIPDGNQTVDFRIRKVNADARQLNSRWVGQTTTSSHSSPTNPIRSPG